MRLSSIAIYVVLMLPHAGSAATVPVAPDTKDDAIKEDMKRLEGTWTVISTKVKNFEFTGGEIISTITIKDDKWVSKYKEGNGGRTGECTFKIDPTSKPKTIDMFGGEGGKDCLPGIYAIDGEQLRICVPTTDAKKPYQRPDNFETKDKSVMVIVARRDK